MTDESDPLPRPGRQGRPSTPMGPVSLLLVLAGGAVGTLLRYAAEEANPAQPDGWPWTTFWINVVGSFVLGWVLTALTRFGPDQGWRRRARLGVGTGFCGGFTTYSAFVIEVDSRLRDGWPLLAISYAVVSVGVGIAVALAGVLAARSLPISRSAAA